MTSITFDLVPARDCWGASDLPRRGVVCVSQRPNRQPDSFNAQGIAYTNRNFPPVVGISGNLRRTRPFAGRCRRVAVVRDAPKGGSSDLLRHGFKWNPADCRYNTSGSVMERADRRRRDRVRVELRLRPATADALHERARVWDVSVSEAGNRLIEAGLEATE